MSRCSRVLVPILATVLLVPCIAQAQSQGGGYWDRGRWIGYMPPHTQQAGPAEQAATAEANQAQAASSDAEQAVGATEAVKPATKPAQASTVTQPVRQAQYAQRVASQQQAQSYARPSMPTYMQPRAQTPAGSFRPAGSRMMVAQRQVGRGVTRASNEVMEPVPVQGAMIEGAPVVEQGNPEAAPIAGLLIAAVRMVVAECGCDPCGCGPCGEYECGFMSVCWPRWLWGRADYLGWWTSGMRLPALVTTNPTTTPTLANAGTVVLFGDDEVNKDARSGGRFTLGVWLDPCAMHGLDATYFGLGSQTTSFYADSDQYTRLGRPFFDIETAAANAHLISYPDPATTGWVSASAETKFQGMEVLYRRGVKRCPMSHVDLLVGWRWLQLKDDLYISESVDDGTLELYDQFNANNNFHGLELGVEWERPLSCCWTLQTVGKLALGGTTSTVRINGAQTGDTTEGLLALASNAGAHKSSSLASVVELGLSLKRRFPCGLEATFGYSFVYWSDVMRAGDQVDLNIDPRQVPPSPVAETHPEFLGRQTDFWAQGLNVGLEYAF